MRNQLLCILILISAFANPGRAQAVEKYRIQFDTVFKKDHLPFNSVRLLDFRQCKTCKSAIIGKNATCYESALEADSIIKNMANAFLSSALVKENNELVIALYDLNITGRRTDYGFVGNLYLHVNFYLGSNNRYQMLTEMDSLYQFPLGNMPAKVISKYCSIALSDLFFSLPDTPTDPSVYTLGDISQIQEYVTRKYKVYVENPKKGVYYSLDEFLNNAPGDTTFVYKHANDFGEIVDNFYKKEEKEGKRGTNLADSCYAIFNGEKWFKPYGDTFKIMKFKNGDFYYYGYGMGPDGSMPNDVFYSGGVIFNVAMRVVDNYSKNHPKQRKASYVFKLDPLKRRGITFERFK